MRQPISLRRQGAWLIASSGSWQMHSVQGPLEGGDPQRQIFRVLTANEEILFISRPVGERGMRELTLESIQPVEQSA